MHRHLRGHPTVPNTWVCVGVSMKAVSNAHKATRSTASRTGEVDGARSPAVARERETSSSVLLTAVASDVRWGTVPSRLWADRRCVLPMEGARDARRLAA